MKEEIIKVIIDKENDDVSVDVESDNIVDVVMAWGLATDALKMALADHYISVNGVCEREAYKEAYNFLGCAFEYAMNIKKNNQKITKNSKEHGKEHSKRNDKEEYIRELKRRKAIYRDLYIDSGDEDYVDKINSCNRMLQELLKNEQ